MDESGGQVGYRIFNAYSVAPASREDFEAAARRCFVEPDMSRLHHAHDHAVRLCVAVAWATNNSFRGPKAPRRRRRD